MLIWGNWGELGCPHIGTLSKGMACVYVCDCVFVCHAGGYSCWWDGEVVL